MAKASSRAWREQYYEDILAAELAWWESAEVVAARRDGPPSDGSEEFEAYVAARRAYRASLAEIDRNYCICPDDPRVYSIAGYQRELAGINEYSSQECQSCAQREPAENQDPCSECWANDIRRQCLTNALIERHFGAVRDEGYRITSPRHLWAIITLRYIEEIESHRSSDFLDDQQISCDYLQIVGETLQSLRIPWANDPVSEFVAGQGPLCQLRSIAARLETEEAEIGEDCQEDEPAGEQQAEEPAGEQQAEEPAREQQAEEEPAGEQQAEEEPAGEQQAEEEPAGEQQAEGETQQDTSYEAELRALAKWAAGNMKGKERRCLEKVIESGGRVSLPDMLLACDWENADQFNRTRQRVNKKLAKQQPRRRIIRHDNEVRLA